MKNEFDNEFKYLTCKNHLSEGKKVEVKEVSMFTWNTYRVCGKFPYCVLRDKKGYGKP